MLKLEKCSSSSISRSFGLCRTCRDPGANRSVGQPSNRSAELRSNWCVHDQIRHEILLFSCKVRLLCVVLNSLIYTLLQYKRGELWGLL